MAYNGLIKYENVIQTKNNLIQSCQEFYTVSLKLNKEVPGHTEFSRDYPLFKGCSLMPQLR
jgi:hypothetical protein